MDILLVQPRLGFERTYPLGLGALSAALASRGHRAIGHHDALQPEARLLERAGSGRFAWIGISGLTANLARALELARQVRGCTDAPIVLGGPHVSIRPGDALDEPAVAAVVCGEGEAAALALCEALEAGRALDSVPGLVTRPAAGSIEPVRLEDLDAWPEPARGMFGDADLDRPGLGRDRRAAPLITSRGCVFGCAYCPTPALSGGTVRRRSPGRVAAEADRLRTDLGVDRLLIEDDQFLADREHALAVCEALARRNRPAAISCVNGLRPERLDRELCTALRAAGCDHVALGLESASPDTLASMGREPDLGRVRAGVEAARSAGLRVTGCFMLGLAGEGPADWLRSLRFAGELGLEIAHLNVYSPLPGASWTGEVAGPEIGAAQQAALRILRGAWYLGYHGRPDRALRILRSTGAGLSAAPEALSRLVSWVLLRTDQSPR